jgi:hypothetical protein
MPTPDKKLAAARAAKEKARGIFRPLAKVCGVGITRQGKNYAVRVNLEEKPAPATRVPKTIDGVPVVVQVTGKVRKQN